MAPVSVQLTACGIDEVIGDAAGGPIWDPAHRVGDVSIEPREEPEPVFAGQILTAVLAGIRNREASGFTSGDWKQFVDLDVKVALYELVRRTEPRDAAAKNDDLRSHGETFALRQRRSPSFAKCCGV